MPTTISVTAADSVQATDNLTALAALHDANGVASPGRVVTFALGGQRATATTGADGTAAVELLVDHDAGAADLAVATPATARHLASSDNRSVDVLREDTSLSYVGQTSARGDLVRVAARLVEADGAPLPGEIVRFRVAGVEGSAATDESGVAETWLVVADHRRAQTVTATFGQSARFLASSTTATITWGRR